MIKTKAAFLEGRLLSSQSEQFKKYSRSFHWLKKGRSSKKSTFVLIKAGNNQVFFGYRHDWAKPA